MESGGTIKIYLIFFYHTGVRQDSYEKALWGRANDGVIILSVVDSRYSTFALNFYKTSLQKFGLTNYLMVCIDTESYRTLTQQGLYCILDTAKNSNLPSSGNFGSAGYIAKTNLKTLLVLQALQLGLTVLVSDLDVVLLQNPFSYFTCMECDLHVTRDRVQLNTGFVYVQPTNNSIYLYETAWKLYLHYHKSHDQSYFNMAVRQLKNEDRNLQMHELPQTQFQCGVYYFQNAGREFAGKPCPKCVMVHNNYMGSINAKMYRFKENLMWTDNTNQYYSNPGARFMVYGNPFYFQDKTWSEELAALKAAMKIAMAAQRILILPKFHCCNCERLTCDLERHRCSLLSVLKINTFDEYFYGLYREHSFLQNPAVPQKYKVRNPQEPLLWIKAPAYESHPEVENNSTLHQLFAQNQKTGATMKEILEFMEPFAKNDIIYFHSLYGVLTDISSDPETPPISQDNEINTEEGEHDLNKAFRCVNYEQWEVKTSMHGKR